MIKAYGKIEAAALHHFMITFVFQWTRYLLLMRNIAQTNDKIIIF